MSQFGIAALPYLQHFIMAEKCSKHNLTTIPNKYKKENNINFFAKINN